MKDFLNKQITITRDELLKKVAEVAVEVAKKVGQPEVLLLTAVIGTELATKLFDEESKEEPKKEGESTTPEQTEKKRYFKIKEPTEVEQEYFKISVGDVGVLVKECDVKITLYNEKWNGHHGGLFNYIDNPHCLYFHKDRLEEVTEEEKVA